MKILLIILAFILVLQACTLKSLSKQPEYRFGDRVFVADGFYKGCKGPVIGYRNWDNDSMYYEVDATCVSVDGKYTLRLKKDFSNGELIPDVSTP